MAVSTAPPSTGGTNDNGTIFNIATNGALSTLASFNDQVSGSYPAGSLVQGSDGAFYGTTEYGGTNGEGTVFRMAADGTLSTLVSFDGINGAEPYGALVQGADGNFYGTTQYGGSNGQGTVFGLTTNGAMASLFSFDGLRGLHPQSGLAQGTDGSFYGTASYGGVGFNGADLSGDGILFRLGDDPPGTPPALIAQPASQIAPVGGAAVFSVKAGGSAPLSYAWQRNGSAIAGATQSSYTASPVSLNDSGGQFGCLVSNAYGSAASASAELSVFNVSGPLFSFHGFDGGDPSSVLTQGIDGRFYGTTEYGGAFGNGTVFSLSTNGLLETLSLFSLIDGAQPSGTLAQGNDGIFYGTTQNGGTYGNGAIFEVTTNGVMATLFSFDNSDGANPQSGLIAGADGNFYGTTAEGGAYGYGTVFSLSTNGVVTNLVSFNGANGAEPYGALIQGLDGNFYGTTEEGGTNGYGTVFSLTAQGVLSTLFSFDNARGAYPQAGLIQGRDGLLYGTASQGGTNGDGAVFSLSTNGVFNALFSFAGTNGLAPEGALAQGSDGNFYGTTAEGGAYGLGTVFSFSTNGLVSNLFSFAGANGAGPAAGLVQGRDGNFYGTTTSGGLGFDGLSWSGNGTVFRLAAGITPQAPLVLAQPQSQIVPAGGSVSFSVSAASGAPLSYLWQRNGAAIAGATQSGYTTNNVSPADSGSLFSCLVGNVYGSTPSSKAALTVSPGSLVQNGGFELGTFADWTTSGNFADCYIGTTAQCVHSGAYGAELGPIGSLGYISETFATTAGELYQISCWLNSDGQTPNEFSISWNGATLFDQQNIGDTGWTNLQFDSGATTTNTVLTIGFRDDPSYLGLDDIAVYPAGVAPPQFQAVTLSSGTISFSWSAKAGQLYQVQFTTNLNQPNWVNLGGTVTASNSAITVSLPVGTNVQLFYRSVLQP